MVIYYYGLEYRVKRYRIIDVVIFNIISGIEFNDKWVRFRINGFGDGLVLYLIECFIVC